MNTLFFSTTFCKRFRFGVCLLSAALLAGCAPGSDSGKPLFPIQPGLPAETDVKPPVFESAENVDSRQLRFHFNEAVTGPSVTTDPPLAVERTETDGQTLTVVFSEDQEIGQSYTAHVDVSDESGNQLTFMTDFSGWNPGVPGVLINEFNPEGSGNNPDCIELFVTEKGNIGGMYLVIGTENKTIGEYVFPTVGVNQGDYIVVHTKPEGLAEEIDEIDELDESGGKLSSEAARDFWMTEAPGLPNSNGAMVLRESKGGAVLDAVLWTDKAFDPDDNKLGWTSSGYIHAADLATLDAWESEGDIPTPDEAVSAPDSTSTRSICRSSDSADTDSKSDWHIVPTSKSTFGEVNTNEVFVPKTK